MLIPKHTEYLIGEGMTNHGHLLEIEDHRLKGRDVISYGGRRLIPDSRSAGRLFPQAVLRTDSLRPPSQSWEHKPFLHGFLR